MSCLRADYVLKRGKRIWVTLLHILRYVHRCCIPLPGLHLFILCPLTLCPAPGLAVVVPVCHDIKPRSLEIFVGGGDMSPSLRNRVFKRVQT